MVDFEDSPPRISFRIERRSIEAALSRMTGIKNTVVRDERSATNALTQMVRASGLNQVDAGDYAFQVMVVCHLDGNSCIVDVSAKFEMGYFPNTAKTSQKAAEAFQGIVVKLQEVIGSP
jgi:hypothetical protein